MNAADNRWPLCKNPHCKEMLDIQKLVPLCPSCRFIGKVGLAIGAVVAGILMKVFG